MKGPIDETGVAEIETLVEQLKQAGPSVAARFVKVAMKERDFDEFAVANQDVTASLVAYKQRARPDLQDTLYFSAVVWEKLIRCRDNRTQANLLSLLATVNGHNRRVVEQGEKTPTADRVAKLRQEIVALELVKKADGHFEVVDPAPGAPQS